MRSSLRCMPPHPLSRAVLRATPASRRSGCEKKIYASASPWTRPSGSRFSRCKRCPFCRQPREGAIMAAMAKKIRWGVLSTANIGIIKVLPAMQRGQYTTITAIASRDLAKAEQAAKSLGIPKAYGSYEELLADPEIDAIYNPLPNHLHVPWSVKALEAGKHVLCEKPLAPSVAEARILLDAAARYPRLKVMEAFMYRHHPQWQRARQIVREGKIGELRTIQSFFSYYLDDPTNIRNISDVGGGGMLDIGCYTVSLARFLFDAEPRRVLGIVEYDPLLKVDRLTSAILD